MSKQALLAFGLVALAIPKLFPDTRLPFYTHACFACLLLYFIMPQRNPVKARADPYGSFHLVLNGGSEENPPKTEWLNMGYWKNETTFPGACRALALKVVEASQMKEGAVVLDVGCGSGESVLNLLTDPSIPRPSRIFGITSLLYHAQRTTDRVEKLQSVSADPATPVTIIHGDAVYGPDTPESTGPCGGPHPFSTSSPVESFDAILALDCAYHFNTRHAFLSQAYHRLNPYGGRIALADVCFSTNAQNSALARLFAWITGVPRHNVVDINTYKKRLGEIGYVEIVVEDITDNVFPSFFAFLRTQGLFWTIMATVMGKVAASGARYIVVGASRQSDCR